MKHIVAKTLAVNNTTKVVFKRKRPFISIPIPLEQSQLLHTWRFSWSVLTQKTPGL